MLESLENIPEYHDVIAHTLGNISALIANKQENEAHSLMKYMIVYAYTGMLMDGNPSLKQDEVEKSVQALKLKEINDTLRLTSMMSFYLNKAGMRPTQRERLFGSRFQKVRDEL